MPLKFICKHTYKHANVITYFCEVLGFSQWSSFKYHLWSVWFCIFRELILKIWYVATYWKETIFMWKCVIQHFHYVQVSNITFEYALERNHIHVKCVAKHSQRAQISKLICGHILERNYSCEVCGSAFSYKITFNKIYYCTKTTLSHYLLLLIIPEL